MNIFITNMSQLWLTRVFELLTDDIVNEERLADDFDFLHSFHGLGNQQQVSEQDTIDLHLKEEKLISDLTETFSFCSMGSTILCEMWGDCEASVKEPDVAYKDKKSSSCVYKQRCESLLPYCLCPLSSSALPQDAAVASPLRRFLSWEPWGRSGCTPWGSDRKKTK